MIVLEVPSRYLLIDEAHYAMMATVLGQAVPVQGLDWNIKNGVKRADIDSYTKLLLLPNELFVKEVPQVPEAKTDTAIAAPKADDDIPF